MKPPKPARQLLTVVLLLSLTLTMSNTLIPQAKAQETHNITIQDFAFIPQNLTIKAGHTVEWNNTDPVIHTLWFVNQTDESTYLLSDPINPNTTWTHTFTEVVDLQYYDFERLWITGFLNVGIHDITITDLAASTPRVVDELIYINATVENQGDYTETFDVSAYYTRISDPLIGTQPVADLLPGENRTLTFEWTPSLIGRYEILANTTEIPDDFDPTDNTRTTTIYVGNGSGNPKSESINGSHVAVFLSALFAAVMIIPEFRKNNKRSQLNMPAVVLKHNLSNNRANPWQEWMRRQKIK